MKYIITILFSFLILSASAQVKPDEYDHPAQIITKDSVVKKGYIRVYANHNVPWAYQGKIRFMEDEKWTTLTKTPKNKEFTKFKPSELKEYTLLDSNYRFMSRPFSDNSSVSFDMFSKNYFMRVIEDGKIKLFFYYDAPSNVYAGTEEGYREMINESMNNYALLQVGDQKLKNITDVDIHKLIADCPKVTADYDAGKYGPSPSDTGKKKGLAKFLSKVNDSNKMKNYIAPVIRDYNSCK